MSQTYRHFFEAPTRKRIQPPRPWTRPDVSMGAARLRGSRLTFDYALTTTPSAGGLRASLDRLQKLAERKRAAACSAVANIPSTWAMVPVGVAGRAVFASG